MLEMKLDNEENRVIEQTRPRVVVQMHIMGATICPSTFQDTPQPLKSNWTTFSPKLMCHNIIKYKTSLSIWGLHALFTICFCQSEFWCRSWALCDFSLAVSWHTFDKFRLRDAGKTKENKKGRLWPAKKHLLSQFFLRYIRWGFSGTFLVKTKQIIVRVERWRGERLIRNDAKERRSWN